MVAVPIAGGLKPPDQIVWEHAWFMAGPICHFRRIWAGEGESAKTHHFFDVSLTVWIPAVPTKPKANDPSVGKFQ